ncbi:unnamed protein product [Acanthoscelides obtectus]|uniref:Palmitoyltransferase n=1 Tax=Acanthoscelides obtectus TaxID=200917 RepID=A0A9P0LSR1_ACAOB|nr:unnamed protein product [Acanthoscelides obtectus]CAK1667068.1 Palmitoyltransferase ZDHHC23 [Acanthoscelides obtectus]
MATIQDRLRIPWSGGAKQIAFDAILPIFIIPAMLLLASMSLWWTIFTFTTVVIFLTLISRFFIKNIPHTKFFFLWTITTLTVLYFIFEFIVIPFLEILLEENIALSVLIFGFVISVCLMKKRTKQLFMIVESSRNDKEGDRLKSCNICQIKVPSRDRHCLWLDCCVGNHNRCLFISALFFATSALTYSSNLTLTSVCHPFTLYRAILLPDDCSDVYKLFELGLSFVSAVYSLALAAILLLLFLQQLVLVSLGITAKEWNKLPLVSKLCLGMFANRPHSKGFCRNWTQVICWSGNPQYEQFNQEV